MSQQITAQRSGVAKAQPRTASPARWHAALRRALDQGIRVRQLECGAWVADSGSDPTAAYLVTLFDCECRAAAEQDPVCKHRARLAYQLGMLELDPEPEPPSPAAPAAKIIPFPSPAERDARRNATTADKAVAFIERMAAADADEPADFFDLDIAA